MPPPGLQIYLRRRVTLTFELLSLRVDRIMSLRRRPLVQTGIKLGSFSKRGLSRHAVSVCLSVRLSVTFVYSVKTSNGIFRLFSPSIVFPYQTSWENSYGNPLTAASNARRVCYNLDSQRISRFAIGNCCTVVSLSHLAAGFLLIAGIGRPNTTRYKQSR